MVTGADVLLHPPPSITLLAKNIHGIVAHPSCVKQSNIEGIKLDICLVVMEPDHAGLAKVEEEGGLIILLFLVILASKGVKE